jgi:hypothetical protein
LFHIHVSAFITILFGMPAQTVLFVNISCPNTLEHSTIYISWLLQFIIYVPRMVLVLFFSTYFYPLKSLHNVKTTWNFAS